MYCDYWKYRIQYYIQNFYELLIWILILQRDVCYKKELNSVIERKRERECLLKT